MLVRKDINRIIDSLGVTWATQFNDLRIGGQTTIETERELKLLCLFHESSYIRDADVINNYNLVDLLLKNPKIIQDEGIVLGLRSNFENFSSFNREVGVTRAFPERCELMDRHLKILDQLYKDKGKTESGFFVGSPPVSYSDDHFLGFMKRSTLSMNKNLSSIQREQLEVALNHALENYDSDFLLFGPLYKYLTENVHSDEVRDLVQWCRLAHNLVVPIETGMAPSIQGYDIKSDWVSYLLNKNKSAHSNERMLSNKFDPEEVFSLYPKSILTSRDVDNLSFDEISDIRSKGSEYFRLLRSLNNGSHGDPIDRKFLDYLYGLNEYLKVIRHSYPKLEFTGWQQDLIFREKKSLTENYIFSPKGIPAMGGLVGASIVGGGLIFINPSNAFYAAMVGFILGYFPGLAEKHIKTNRVKKLDALNSLVGQSLYEV